MAVNQRTNVANNGHVLHLAHVFGHDDILVTSGGDKDVGSGHNILQCLHIVSSHQSLQSANRVNLGHNDTSTLSPQRLGATLADITIACDNADLASKHDISCTHDTIDQRVAASINVITNVIGYEQVMGCQC